ncbi:hypothetical protein KN63_06610 [Smithella sp. F21]|jgi:long-chain acyl-CoA synthetase|nr:hypothetical protein KN63_06610 [Smithella sp. F21]
MSFERIWHKSYPAGVAGEVTFDETVMPEILTKTAGRFPDRDALIFMGTKITYRELDALVNRFARALTSLGVAKGDKVAMLLPNVPQIVIAEYATFRIGGAVVMNNPLYTERELAYQLNDSDSKVLITLDMLFPMAMKLKATTKLEHVVICRIGDYLPEALKPLFPPVEFEKKEGVHLFMDLLNAQSDAPVANAAGWDDVGALMYTGGTTGVSKGVMLTHANISRNTQQLRYWFPTLKDGEEGVLAIFPFFHSAGWTGVQNMCILAGWTDILVPKPEPDTIVYLLENFKPSLLPGVPTVYIGLLNNEKFRKLDFSFLKAFMAGAAPLAVETIKQLKALKNVPIINVYGLTEICPMGTATPWGGNEKSGTVGVPLPSTDLKIVDLVTGKQEMENGQEGEICFKGPQVMKGYYKRPEETAIALKDGWLYTGDIGFLDADGYLTLVDRKKDLIVASGYNIYPKEIDELLMEHPKVMEVCTIGVPDAYRGETVKTFVVVRPGQTMTADEVTAFCKERLAPYKVPKLIAFIDALPKSTVGKILRRELRDREMKKQA